MRLDGRLDGDFDRAIGLLADGYGRLEQGRLVVIGEPGAGKTVLAMLLALGLLASRNPGTRVPVLLSISSWDPLRERLDDWIVRTLAVPYYGGDPQIPRLLLTHGLLLPVLDGLDEIPESARRGAIRGINQTIGTDRPLVVTCRAVEYEELIRGGAPRLRRAPVVEVLPVPPADVIGYLGDLDWPDGVGWDGVFDRLRAEPPGPVAEALSTPLMVTTARLVYRRGGRDPAELLDEERFDCRYAVEDYLTHQVVEAAYAPGPRVPEGAQVRGRWSPEQARRWLTSSPATGHGRGLGRYRRGRGAVARGAVRSDRFHRLVRGGQPGAGTAVVVPERVRTEIAARVPRRCGAERRVRRPRRRCSDAGDGGGPNSRAGDAAGRRGVRQTARRVCRAEHRDRAGAGRARLAQRAAVPGRPGDSRQLGCPGPAFGRGRCGAGRYGFRRAGDVRTAGGPGCGRRLLFHWASGWPGWPGSVGFGDYTRAAWHRTGHYSGAGTVGVVLWLLLPGTLFAMFVVLTRAWPRFVVARWWLALRGWLPWRLLGFLADARQREILRQSGGTYQFRHIPLQEALAGQQTLGRPPQTPRRTEPESVRRRVVLAAGLAAACAGTGAVLTHHQDQSRAVFADPDGQPMSAVAFRPVTHELVWAAGDGRTWWGNTLSGGRLLADPHSLVRPGGKKPPHVHSLAFDPTGRRLLAVGCGKAVELWDIRQQPPALLGRWPVGSVRRLVFHPSGGYLVGGYQASNSDTCGYFVARIGADSRLHGLTSYDEVLEGAGALAILRQARRVPLRRLTRRTRQPP